jgi:hypothetical protein
MVILRNETDACDTYIYPFSYKLVPDGFADGEFG